MADGSDTWERRCQKVKVRIVPNSSMQYIPVLEPEAGPKLSHPSLVFGVYTNIIEPKEKRNPKDNYDI